MVLDAQPVFQSAFGRVPDHNAEVRVTAAPAEPVTYFERRRRR
jgi:hypothetical protein